jgi:hypothetical protein
MLQRAASADDDVLACDRACMRTEQERGELGHFLGRNEPTDRRCLRWRLDSAGVNQHRRCGGGWGNHVDRDLPRHKLCGPRPRQANQRRFGRCVLTTTCHSSCCATANEHDPSTGRHPVCQLVDENLGSAHVYRPHRCRGGLVQRTQSGRVHQSCGMDDCLYLRYRRQRSAELRVVLEVDLEGLKPVAASLDERTTQTNYRPSVVKKPGHNGAAYPRACSGNQC